MTLFWPILDTHTPSPIRHLHFSLKKASQNTKIWGVQNFDWKNAT